MKHEPGRGAAEDTIVIEVPAQLKGLAESVRALIDSAPATLKSTRGYHAINYAAIERRVEPPVSG